MQAASCFVQPSFPSKFAIKASPTLTAPKPATTRGSPIKAASGGFEPLSVNYNSPFSVFPAEACETIGGDACDANMGPETKLNKPEGGNIKKTTVSEPDREYFDYSSEPNSVLRAEACDDLGGDFCEGPL